MPRFFVSGEGLQDNIIHIDGADAHHIARSLRMAEGDEITVCTGDGREHSCTLIRIRDEECLAEIKSTEHSKSESNVKITLCMAYPKSDKLETVIQKSVELGVYRIIPFESSRCIKRPKAEKVEKQTARLMRIAEEAAKQCGRAIIPEVTAPMTFSQMLNQISDNTPALLCYENEDGLTVKGAIKALTSPKEIFVIVGSEGGFSPEEAELAVSCGCTSVSLGRRILRCETAPLYALSALSYEFELD